VYWLARWSPAIKLFNARPAWYLAQSAQWVNHYWYLSFSHPGQLSLAILLWVAAVSTSENRHRQAHHTWHTNCVFVVLQCKLVSGWWLRKRRLAPPYGVIHYVPVCNVCCGCAKCRRLRIFTPRSAALPLYFLMNSGYHVIAVRGSDDSIVFSTVTKFCLFVSLSSLTWWIINCYI